MVDLVVRTWVCESPYSGLCLLVMPPSQPKSAGHVTCGPLSGGSSRRERLQVRDLLRSSTCDRAASLRLVIFFVLGNSSQFPLMSQGRIDGDVEHTPSFARTPNELSTADASIKACRNLSCHSMMVAPTSPFILIRAGMIMFPMVCASGAKRYWSLRKPDRMLQRNLLVQIYREVLLYSSFCAKNQQTRIV